MVKVRSKALQQTIEVDRIIGRYTQDKKGPCLIIFAGIHGNEPSGIFALKRIFETLEQNQYPIKGELIGVTGNMPALEKEVRMIDYDLNRICKVKTVEELKEQPYYNSSEGKELEKLLEIVNDLLKPHITEVFFMDCHTTSSASQPFISAKDFPHSHIFARNIPVFTVIGMDRGIQGTLDELLNEKGFIGFTFEAGQHDELASIEHHEAAIWLLLGSSGCIEFEDMHCYPLCHENLAKTVIEGKKKFDLLYKYAIGDGEDFRMEPGFINFQKVKKGDLLAHSNGNPVLSEWDGRILMPLYQKQGVDGFFIVTEIEVEVEV